MLTLSVRNRPVLCTLTLWLVLIAAIAPAAATDAESPAPTLPGAAAEGTVANSSDDVASKKEGKKSEAEDEDAGDAKDSKKKAKGSPITARYDNGLRIESADGKYAARIVGRAQLRMTDVSSDDLVGEEDGVEEETGFEIRRARIKIDGHAYQPWLKYKFEYGLAANILLTWRFDIARYEKATLNVGQWKVFYNRERVDSSGKQQFVERSIVNSLFTVDRQQGIGLSGRLFKGTRGDSRYAVGAYTGTGRGGDLEGDKRPMYVGRWQWNFLGRDVPFSQSDVKSTPKTIASLAVAAASNVGEFTRWSSGGGGQLPGFADGMPEQYKTDQWMAEFALMRKGLSIQSEYHFKEVDDRVNDVLTELDGMYAQVGYFFHELFEAFPEKLEFAARWARVDTEAGIEIPADREFTVAANYFFAGHNNKLTMDVSRLESTLPGGSEDDGIRARLQWDISF